METIGDSFLKYAASVSLYLRYTKHHEGKLTFARGLLISNATLCTLGRRKGLPQRIAAQVLEPSVNWLPPCYRNLAAMEKKSARSHQRFSTKAIADNVEALFGVVLMESGARSALLTMEWLGLPVLPPPSPAGGGGERKMWSDMAMPSALLYPVADVGAPSRDKLFDRLDKFEEGIGYR